MDYNIILVTLDGMRSDRLDLSPSLMKVKDESLFFQNMITVAPYTIASLHAIFSGMYAKDNGVNAYYKMSKFKENEIITIGEILQENGYFTSCDILHDAVIPKRGFEERSVFDEDSVNFKERHSELIKKISKKDKFFLFLHYTEPHKNLVKELLSKDKDGKIVDKKDKSEDDKFFSSINDNKKRYDSYMPELDGYVKKIMETIDECELRDNTIIVFHADHGTSLGEKIGEKFYGVFVYDYTIKVFSIIKIPKQEPKILKQQCQTIDLFPTILELVGIKLDSKLGFQGESLLDIVNSKQKEDRIAFVETGGLYGPWPSPTKHNVFCIRHKNKKLIYNETPNTWEFYDLEEDPQETNNIFDEDSELIDEYRRKLKNHFEK
tara:strand:+ start:8430 stop:9563 length:1134 start_codon:yes stop_codon:yes gene_type:complete